MKWISVEDRLPEVWDGEVLVALRFPNGNRTVTTHWLRNRWWLSAAWKEVTHWMLLPPAPGEQ